jgi:hypothetical protein
MEDYAGEDFLGAVNRGIGQSWFLLSFLVSVQPSFYSLCSPAYLLTALLAPDRIVGPCGILPSTPHRVFSRSRTKADQVENLEKRVAAERPSPERLERLTYIWKEVVRLERNFWDMGLNKTY